MRRQPTGTHHPEIFFMITATFGALLSRTASRIPSGATTDL
jgi:hypothetical protein